MFKNYLITIWRQIQKNKLFSFINIFGLALGMAACLVIAQYVKFHTSFDEFHTKSDRIFRVESTVYKSGEELGLGIKTPEPLADQLLIESPFIEQAMRVWPFTYANSTLVYEGRKDVENYEVSAIYFGEQTGFEIFDFNFLAGSAASFSEKYKAILPWDVASKIFQNPQDAIGETFTLSNNNGKADFEIVGVMETIPENSHIQFELLLSYPSMEKFNGCYKNWDCASTISYLLLNDEKNKEAVISSIAEIVETNTDFADYTFDWKLQDLASIHLNSIASDDFTAGVDKRTIAAFSLVAVIILVIAWINYMNLSLVRTVERLKEMGVRMSMGSSKRQITGLFLAEAFIMNLLAFGLAIGLVQMGEGVVQSVTNLSGSAIGDIQVILMLAGLIVIGTVLIGFYPNILLKSLKAVNVLTGRKGITGGNKLRKSLVFAQFMITTFLLAGTYTVYKQINFMKNADLKIDVENILVLESPPGEVESDDREDLAKFKKLTTALKQYPEITQVTSGGEVPGEPISWRTRIQKKNDEESSGVETSLISMDYDYPEFFDIAVVAGRALREGDSPWSKGDVVINERLAEMLGFSNPEDALGQDLEGFYAPLTVRGVLENHHHTSLHSNYDPIAFIVSGWVEFYFIKIDIPEDTENKKALLAQSINNVKKEWDNIFTDYPIDYFFLDSHFNEQYEADDRFGKLFTGFSVLAIVIACLGLFGLTAFTVQQRTKEIGIRKVLGASFANLMGLLSKEYLLLVTIAASVTLPIAYFVMEKWLENYIFRIDIGTSFILLPLFLIMIFALISISSRVVGAAAKNPVDSLRYE